MQPPKLSPLQSRLLAFAITTCTVVVLWMCFRPNYFAYAADVPLPNEVVQRTDFEASIPPPLPDEPPIEIRDESLEVEDGDALYAPLFAYFDRSLVGRQDDDLLELNNNQVKEIDIAPNQTKHFRFKKSQLGTRSLLEEFLSARTLEDTTNDTDGDADGGLAKRQSQSRLWISANTCRQPTPTVKLVTEPVPQLTMWIWTSTSSSTARPSSSSKPFGNSTFNGGQANFTLATEQDVYVSITAPSLTQGWDGSWNFEIAASTDKGYYHNYDNSTNFIYMVDTDSDSTLFITHNMTSFNDTEEVKKWITEQGDNMPFDIYAFPDDAWSPMMGLERSYCGLKTQFESSNNLTVNTSITTQFGQGLPKGLFNVQGLKTSMKYTGFLVLNGTSNMTIDNTATNGGGRVFKSFQWQTKDDDTCQVIFGLEECSTVAYAVPSSSEWKQNDTGLMAFYDGLAKKYMQNFRRSLQQVACDTTGTAQYSLARNCTDCENDYKSWLCSVLIPRCEDFNASASWLFPRNINTPFANGSLPTDESLPTSFFPANSFDSFDSDANAGENVTTGYNASLRIRSAYNSSRVPKIDEVIKPGPYKELLPCEDLCFDIVRSCPAQLGFACPDPPMRALSYGSRDPRGRDLRCNFPGAVVDLTLDTSAAADVAARLVSVLVAVAVAVATAL